MYKLILLTLITICSFNIKAIEIKDLYQYSTLVDDKTWKARQFASKDALLKVLIKVSGQEITSSNPLYKKAARNISDYMLKYEYKETAEAQQLIIVKFEPQKVNQLLESSELPIWGNRRPQVVIWLAFEDSWRRELVTQDSNPQIERLLKDRANRRGVPIVIPLLDLQDRANINVSDVWANFSEPVNKASIRYSAERVVTARLYQNKETQLWQLDWRFTDHSDIEVNQLNGDKQQIVGQMIDAIAENLSQEYSVAALRFKEQGQFDMTLLGINDFLMLEAAKRRLLSLSVVNDLTLKKISSSKIELKLNLLGNGLDLENALKLDSNFEKHFDPLVPEKEILSFEYRWLGSN